MCVSTLPPGTLVWSWQRTELFATCVLYLSLFPWETLVWCKDWHLRWVWPPGTEFLPAAHLYHHMDDQRKTVLVGGVSFAVGLLPGGPTHLRGRP